MLYIENLLRYWFCSSLVSKGCDVYMGLARHLSCRGVVFMGKAWPVMLTWILKSLSSIIKVWE